MIKILVVDDLQKVKGEKIVKTILDNHDILEKYNTKQNVLMKQKILTKRIF